MTGSCCQLTYHFSIFSEDVERLTLIGHWKCIGWRFYLKHSDKSASFLSSEWPTVNNHFLVWTD